MCTRIGRWTLACALVAGWAWLLPAQGAEPDNGAKADGGAKADAGARGGRPGFQRGGMMGPMGGRAMDGMINSALGLDSPVKADQLPLGVDRRLVTRVPVGGIDTLQDFGNGLKVEDVFTLTAEQAKAVQDLREKYKGELETLEKAWNEKLKESAADVKKLREKYEQLANDTLTGTAKTEKAQLDALTREFSQQRTAKAEESRAKAEELKTDVEKLTAKAREERNFEALRTVGEKAREFTRTIMDARQILAKAIQEKMKAAVTGDAKTKLEEALKRIEDRGLGGLGAGGPGRGGFRRPQDPAAKKAEAPEKDF